MAIEHGEEFATSNYQFFPFGSVTRTAYFRFLSITATHLPG